MSVIGKIMWYIKRSCNFLIKKYLKSRFAECGSEVYLGNNGIATYENIKIGDHVYIGSNYVLQSMHGEIIIGNHVMFGPGVHIHGGNHIYDQVGVYMDTVKKEKNSDPTIVIEDDVWIGANVIILGGVHIGFGSIIGAGSVVTHDVVEGGIYAGNPARLVKMRFDIENIKKHKQILTERIMNRDNRGLNLLVK